MTKTISSAHQPLRRMQDVTVWPTDDQRHSDPYLRCPLELVRPLFGLTSFAATLKASPNSPSTWPFFGVPPLISQAEDVGAKVLGLRQRPNHSSLPAFHSCPRAKHFRIIYCCISPRLRGLHLNEDLYPSLVSWVLSLGPMTREKRPAGSLMDDAARPGL